MAAARRVAPGRGDAADDRSGSPILHSGRVGRVGFAFTRRNGGTSPAPFDTANLAGHVGDDPDCVERNRREIARRLGIDADWFVVNQVHGSGVVLAERGATRDADAIIVEAGAPPAAIFTADCLPLLLLGRSGERAAIVHAGWRGLDRGVIEAAASALADLGDPAGAAYLGPSIGTCCYEVGAELADAFVRRHGEAAAVEVDGSPHLDITWIAKRILDGIADVDAVIELGPPCTHSADLFSYRLDGPETGRQAVVAWVG